MSFAIRARAMFPMLGPEVLVRVITTRTPAARRRRRSRSETSSVRSGSLIPVTTPCVPPPSLIFRVVEPGPIGSVARFARASCPGSITTTGPPAARAAPVNDESRGEEQERSRHRGGTCERIHA